MNILPLAFSSTSSIMSVAFFFLPLLCFCFDFFHSKDLLQISVIFGFLLIVKKRRGKC